MTTEVKPNAEVTQRAILETKTPVTPAELLRKNLVIETRKKLDEGDVQGALVNMGLRHEADDKYTGNADTVISAQKTDKEGNREWTGDEKVRRDESINAIKLANGFVEKGWPVDAIEQNALIDAVKPALATLWPDAKAFFEDTAISPAVREARVKDFIEEQLKNPKVRELVQQLLEQRSGKKPPPGLEVPMELKAKAKEVEILSDQNSKAKTRVNSELTAVNGDLSREYGDPTAKPPVGGARWADLQALRANRGKNVGDKAAFTRDIASKDARLAQLLRSRDSSGSIVSKGSDGWSKTDTRGASFKVIQGEIDALTKDLDDPTDGLRAKLRGADSELAKLADYERDLAEWNAEKKRLEGERQTLIDQGNLLGANNTLLKGEIRDIVNARINWEKQYVADLQSTMTDGFRDHLTDQLRQAEVAQKKVLEEQIASTIDPAEKKLLEGMAGRWDQRKESGVFRKREVTVANKAQVDIDYALLMTPPPKGGPEIILRKMLEATGAPAMTTAEIDAKLADKAFVDKMQGDVITKLLERRLDTAKMPEADLKYIAESSWGEATIQAALQNKDALKKLEAQMRELGLSAGTMHEMFSKKGVKKGLLLGILLGIITFGVVPGIMVKEFIKGEAI